MFLLTACVSCRWLRHIPTTMRRLGLDVCVEDRVAVKPSLYPQLNEIHVAGLRDAPRGVSKPVDEFKDGYMEKFEEECHSGVSTHYEFLCFVARVPG